MDYELRNLILEGAYNPNTKAQKISVVTGIVGDQYGFVKTDTFDVPIDSVKSMDDNIQGALKSAALNFIQQTYPTIK